MKQWIAGGLLLCMLFSLCACRANPKAEQHDEKVQVIATIFPLMDFAREIGGELAETDMLLPPGTESHHYEPTPADMINISNCDVFLYIGGESDTWVEDLLSSMDTSGITIVRLMDCVDAVYEETVEGMEADVEEDHAYDEHIWTSPKNAIKMAAAIADALIQTDPANEKSYELRAAEYTQSLETLDAELLQIVQTGKRKLILFGDRFPFRYFAQEYDLSYRAAFPGCSSETEPSAATMAYLIKTVKDEEIPVVFYLEMSNQKVAQAICEATGAQTRLLHSCHNVSADELAAGATYLSLMRQNETALTEALN